MVYSIITSAAFFVITIFFSHLDVLYFVSFWHVHFKILRVLYGSANDPRTTNDPGPEMIPILDPK